MTRFLSLCIGFIALIVTHAQAQTAEDILDKSHNAMGSEEAWASIETIRSKGSFAINGAALGNVETFMKRPGKILIVTSINGFGTEVTVKQGCDGQICYESEAAGIARLLTGEEGEALLSQALGSEDFMNWRAQFSDVTYVGEGNFEGVKTFVVRGTLNTGEVVTTEYDQSTFFPLEIRMDIPGLGTAKTKISDYREIDGLIFQPFRIDIQVPELSTSVTLDEIVLNDDLDDGLFVLPRALYAAFSLEEPKN